MIIQHYIELMRYYRPQLITLIIATVLIFALVNTVMLIMSPIYTAAASVTMLPTEAEMAFSQSDTHRKEAGRTLTETYIEYIKSRPVIAAAIEKTAGNQEDAEAADNTIFDVTQWDKIIASIKEFKNNLHRWIYILGYGSYIPIPEEDREIERIRNAINVKNVTNTHILQIEVSLPQPETAARLANTLAEAYVETMTAEDNKDASELETYLNKEIKEREKKVSSLRAKQAAYKKRYGILPENNAEQRKIDVLQRQLDVLYERSLSTKLSLTSATQVKLVEAATVPVYPTSPNVLENTVLGLLAGILIALIVIVAKDSVSDRIVTSLDLQRIAGARSMGIMKRAWVTRGKWRTLRKLGVELDRRLAILGDLDAPGSSETAKQPVSTELIPRAEYQLPVEADKLHPIKHIENLDEYDAGKRPVLQVTGVTDMVNICWAAVGLAAALAIQGRDVICRLPDGTINNSSALEKWVQGMENRSQGRIYFSEDDLKYNNEDTLTIQCLGPLSADLNLTKAMRVSPAIICILPVNKVQEKMVEALQRRVASNERANVSFMLMA